MIVSVVKCRDLPAKDSNTGSSDPYVKLQLLPDKQHKVKTRVLRKTRNPVYDEDFTFYGITQNQLQVSFLNQKKIDEFFFYIRLSESPLLGRILFSFMKTYRHTGKTK